LEPHATQSGGTGDRPWRLIPASTHRSSRKSKPWSGLAQSSPTTRGPCSGGVSSLELAIARWRDDELDMETRPRAPRVLMMGQRCRSWGGSRCRWGCEVGGAGAGCTSVASFGDVSAAGGEGPAAGGHHPSSRWGVVHVSRRGSQGWALAAPGLPAAQSDRARDYYLFPSRLPPARPRRVPRPPSRAAARAPPRFGVEGAKPRQTPPAAPAVG